MSSPAQKPAATPPVPIRTPRMTIQSITRGKVAAPYRITIHGPDGVGKTTFGADAPSPVFLGTEAGTDNMDVARFPTPESWADVLEAIHSLAIEPGKFKSLVVDSLDWAEPLLWRELCEKAKVDTIEEVGGGFGKGYNAAIDGWRVFLAALERLQREQGMHVVLVAHSFIKKFANPEGDDFDRYILKLNEKAAALIREWCKGVYFANYETFAVKDKAKRVRGVSTGARLMHTQRTAAFDAKDRYGLPESLPLSWAEFDGAARAGQPNDPADLIAEIQRKAKALGGDLEKVTLESLAKNAGDAARLAQLNDWVNSKVAAKAAKEG